MTCLAPDSPCGREAFLSVMRRRFACKLYDRVRSPSDEDTAFILECARLSPSSFGIEHWHLFAVRSGAAIARLSEACFAQDAVGTAPLVVVAACRRAWAYDPDGDFIASRGSRFPGGRGVFVDDYRGYYDYLRDNSLLDHWARSQCYIACANMMTGAAAAGIDSCAIEGFDNEAVLGILDLESAKWETGLIASFGYSAEKELREKIRMAPSEIITYV